MKLSVLFLFLGLSLSACTLKQTNKSSETQKKFPKAERYVNDFDDILTTDQENTLNTVCSDYDKKTTNQIVVATFKSMEPYENIETFGTALYNEWGIGTKEKNNGLLIVVFKENHKVRISTGLGTEKIL